MFAAQATAPGSPQGKFPQQKSFPCTSTSQMQTPSRPAVPQVTNGSPHSHGPLLHGNGAVVSVVDVGPGLPGPV